MELLAGGKLSMSGVSNDPCSSGMQRLYALNAWRETPFFTERERAALEWTEAVTLIADTHAADAA